MQIRWIPLFGIGLEIGAKSSMIEESKLRIGLIKRSIVGTNGKNEVWYYISYLILMHVSSRHNIVIAIVSLCPESHGVWTEVKHGVAIMSAQGCSMV